MSEFRRDPLSDHWVIIAPNRVHRPEQFTGTTPQQLPGRCPFCRGHEADTPEATASYAADGRLILEGPWQVRVIPNKYPAVEDVRTVPTASSDFFEMRHGIGVHEVIIECPDHVVSCRQLSGPQFGLVFQAYRDRLSHWRSDPRLAYAQIFKNSGASAGASLEHAHSQMIATSIVPTQVQTELERAESYFHERDRCVFCAMLQHELTDKQRVVAECEDFVAFCPYASQFPYETWVVPRSHSSHFEFTEDRKLERLAVIVRDLVGRFEDLLIDLGFNYLIHTAPFESTHLKYYHWHLEIFPRLTKTAGFEWGAGDYINIIPPEKAAATLRELQRP
jgi:UDPglucose--hexose-1-phosphate uridylyltransferase